MKKKLMDLLAKKEARKQELLTKTQGTEDVAELRGINTELTSLNTEIADLKTMIESIPDDKVAPEAGDIRNAKPEENTPGLEQRATPVGQLNVLGTYGMEKGEQTEETEKREKDEAKLAEKRGKDLKEMRTVTVGSSNIVLQAHQASNIKPTFNEISSLIDRVSTLELPGGESFKQPYEAGFGEGGYSAEGEDYTTSDQIFGYADMSKAKITAYSEDSEEVVRLPAAAYDAIVMKSVPKSVRKKISKEILVGTGASNHLAGIFSAAATAIDSGKDIEIVEIDETTLDEILYSFGGDEDVEDVAVLILNKLDLKAFATLRDADGRKIHTVVNKGNTGTIDNVPYVINSACKAISAAATTTGQYSMAYGPLSNYTLAVFSDLEVQRSIDYKFKQGMIAHRGSIFCAGNVTAKNGFLRVKKG